TARKDEDGGIINGLLFIHGWSGDYASFKRFYEFTSPGDVFDADEYFIISTTSLGSPGTASPSTTNLGKDFPQYTVTDMVNLQHRLLTEVLGVKHLRGVVGTSMGGFQSLMWSVRYPDFMDFVIDLVTGPAVVGRNLAIFQLTNNIIESHPDYLDGNYRDNPLEALRNANQLMFLFAFTVPYYHEEFHEKELLLNALDEQGDEGMQMDARDVVWRNRAAISFDIRDQMDKIGVKSLIIGIEGDEYFPPEIEAIPLSRSIKNSDLLTYKSQLGHLGINEIDKMRDAIIKLLNEPKKLS
ncbi:MAG TPA: alpha/beta fold hydrolase, partial [Methanobacterium sp.]|nr:alpha/beta fold hydrolase [Methanobacterium sp.]